jgi:predicted nucleotidyltransferase
VEHRRRPASDIVDALTRAIQDVLGDDLLAFYLYGSVVTGGFDAGVSDVDLVAVTASEVTDLDLAGLERMHDEFAEQHTEWRDRIEVVYVGRATLASFRTNAGSLAVISPGEPFHVAADGPADWIQNWYLVRETGMVLAGPPPDALVPLVSWAEFVAATARYATEVRSRQRTEASSGSLAYTVLTMCRALRVVLAQTHGSKQEAAAWARERMPEGDWLIDASLACRLSGGTVGLDDQPSRDAVEVFVALVDDEIHGRLHPQPPAQHAVGERSGRGVSRHRREQGMKKL